jgi:hypothetical protein
VAGRLGVGLDLAPESPDGLVDRAGHDARSVAQHLEEGVALDGLSAMGGEERQHLQLVGGERHLATRRPPAPRDEIHHQVADVQAHGSA